MPKINVQDEIAELKAKIRLYPLLGVAAGMSMKSQMLAED